MPGTHVTEQMSAAIDHELSDAETAMFQAHLAGCSECAAAFTSLRSSVDALRSLPRARMSQPVRLPATTPVAVQRFRPLRPGGGWATLRRFLPGGATAIAAVAAALILVVATRSQAPQSTAGLAPQHPGAPPNPAVQVGCPSGVAGGGLTQAPAGYQHRVSVSDPARPGEQLVLATLSADAAAGQQVPLFAQLLIPRASAAAPGQSPAALYAQALPCVSVSGAISSVQVAPAASSPGGAAAVPDAAERGSPVEVFTVPPGTASGTQLHIVATVPPGYPNAGEPPLTADLVITVR